MSSIERCLRALTKRRNPWLTLASRLLDITSLPVKKDWMSTVSRTCVTLYFAQLLSVSQQEQRFPGKKEVDTWIGANYQYLQLVTAKSPISSTLGPCPYNISFLYSQSHSYTATKGKVN